MCSVPNLFSGNVVVWTFVEWHKLEHELLIYEFVDSILADPSSKVGQVKNDQDYRIEISAFEDLKQMTKV